GVVLDAAVPDWIGLAPRARPRPRELHDAPARRRVLRLRDAAREREDARELEGRAARIRDRVIRVLLRQRELGLLRLGVDHLVVAQLHAPGGERLLQAGVDARSERGDELAALLGPFLGQPGLAARQGRRWRRYR